MRASQTSYTLPALFVFGLFFLASFARIAYLALFLHDTYLEQSKGPREISVHVEPDRGTIRDRYNRALVTKSRISFFLNRPFFQILFSHSNKSWVRPSFIS